MTLVALDGTPLIAVGAAHRQGLPTLVAHSATLLDAANEACIMVGRVFTADGASHTIDTTGSSKLNWRTSAVTFANAGTTVKVGLAAVDTTTGPSVRAANAADVITFDVSKSMTGGGGGVTANAWQAHTPDAGSKTIAHGDLVAFAVQMTARGGADVVNVSTPSSLESAARPSVTAFTGAAYSTPTRLPNAIITFSDGVRGWFAGGYTASVGATTRTWNNGSAAVEYGNLLQFPFPVRAYGVIAGIAVSGDVDLVLYSSPLGTPASAAAVSIDANAVGLSTVGVVQELFASPVDLAANTPYAIVAKPTSATDVSMDFVTMSAAAEMVVWNNGTNGYAVNRASGAFAAQNSSKDRFAIGLLVGAFDSGAASYPASRAFTGM